MRVRINYQTIPYSAAPGASISLARRPVTFLNASHGDAMKDPREIKKYPNRRLYDTGERRYITIADVRKLVVEEVEFTVVDNTSHEDITDRILLQVMSEQEQSGVPLLCREVMLQVIRLYGSPLQGLVGECLRQSLSSALLQSRDIPLPEIIPARSPQSERSEIVAMPLLKAH